MGDGDGDAERPNREESEVEDVSGDGSTDDGREDDICPWFAPRLGLEDSIGETTGTELRGTPHSAHIFAAVGLNPGGFRFPHTSHSQLSNKF